MRFAYLKAKDEELFLDMGTSVTIPLPSKAPHMFASRADAYNAYEEYRTRMKMAGKPTIQFELKEVDL